MYDAPWHVPSALFDPGWVDRMRDSTAVSEFSPEAAIITAVFFGVFVVLVATAFLVKSRGAGEVRLTPLTWITDTAKIREIFLNALRRRSKIRLTFSREDATGVFTDAALSEVYSDSLTLELSATVQANRGWIGKRVECDFRLRLDPAAEQWNFYTFVAGITDARVVPGQFAQVTISLPSRLEMEQKRAFLRVEPGRADVRELDIWPETHVRDEPHRPDDPETWGHPDLTLTETTAPDIALDNVSGGGLRLSLRGDALRTGLTLLTPGRRVYLFLRLADRQAAGESILFRLACQVMNAYAADAPDGSRAFGLRFVGFGEPAADNPARLGWKALQGGGVPAVDDWAYAKHLDMYRARGK
ncbi:hypothetical protein G3N56_01265 [Desulfovibrio sulfodismutans]|uniref:PilZ domain-containing protein n=1 Tax=Desulfolutivibrio sulfodismutans TaxID=63561 RepID=A0A7K3NHU4_9BACT|nr:hypothetical protein [Desulfolutivibrio sulfodismutans]NDY55373.1 hypothetical protein [Desulfolutivibrio sulfodismutans]QLA12251.1 hypothetical protein GD606_08175 [Desulfolutivibrio sulfodismutans DSM 3696]